MVIVKWKLLKRIGHWWGKTWGETRAFDSDHHRNASPAPYYRDKPRFLTVHNQTPSSLKTGGADISATATMTVIAVAGGSGGVGKTLVERLVQEPKFKVIVLSRQVRIICTLARDNY